MWQTQHLSFRMTVSSTMLSKVWTVSKSQSIDWGGETVGERQWNEQKMCLNNLKNLGRFFFSTKAPINVQGKQNYSRTFSDVPPKAHFVYICLQSLFNRSLHITSWVDICWGKWAARLVIAQSFLTWGMKKVTAPEMIPIFCSPHPTPALSGW